jgi:hypothetical protein
MNKVFSSENLKGRALGKPRCRREDNIRLDLRKHAGKAWTRYIWLRIGPVADTVINLQVPLEAGDFLTS